MLGRSCLVGCLLASPLVARADLIPGNAKVATHNALVHFELPPGKALVVENTWNMPTLIEPEQPTGLSWKGMDGEMRLRLVDRAAAPPPRPADGRRPDMFVSAAIAARTIRAAKRGVVCSEPFGGRTVIPDWSPASEYRHEFTVTLVGDKCESTHTAAWLNEKGEPVDPGMTELPPGQIGLGEFPPAPPLPPPPPPVAAPPEPAPAPAPVPVPVTRSEPPAPASGCGCRGAPSSGAPGLLLLLALAWRRRGVSPRRARAAP